MILDEFIFSQSISINRNVKNVFKIKNIILSTHWIILKRMNLTVESVHDFLKVVVTLITEDIN